jgi:hypothetical protein
MLTYLVNEGKFASKFFYVVQEVGDQPFDAPPLIRLFPIEEMPVISFATARPSWDDYVTEKHMLYRDIAPMVFRSEFATEPCGR